MLKDAKGNRLYRTVKIRVKFPEEIFPEKVFTQHAGPRQGFGPDGVDAMLENVADQLDTLYPFWNFIPIELAPEGRTAKFFFKFVGYRATKPTAPAPELPPSDESSAPTPETAESSAPTETNVSDGNSLEVSPSSVGEIIGGPNEEFPV